MNENQEGVDIRTECFGTTDCIEWLDPHHFIPQGRYFHDIIQVKNIDFDIELTSGIRNLYEMDIQ